MTVIAVDAACRAARSTSAGAGALVDKQHRVPMRDGLDGVGELGGSGIVPRA
jgi:hypothetical protein